MTDDEDQWDEEWSEVICDRCGELRRCQFGADPFVSEVYPEDGPYEKSWWCLPCWQERKDDI